MSEEPSGGWIRQGGGPSRPTFLELFFDLAFVFALTQLSEYLITDLSWPGAFRTLILTVAVFWTWTAATWVTDLYESNHPGLQVLLVVVMFGVMVMGTSASGAFHSQSVVFAAAYAGTHLCRSLVLTAALRGRALQRRPQRVLMWALASTPLWLAGGVLRGAAQLVLWTAGLVVDYLGPKFGWPVPRLGHSPDSEWDLGAEHIAERYRQMFIIGLGDTILVMGLAYVDTPSTPARAATLTVTFATTVLIWQIYFRYAGKLLAGSIRGGTRWAAQLAAEYHLLMVAGIVVTAVGDAVAIRHPLGHTRPSGIAVIVGGPALFLAGRVLFGRLVLGHPSWSRIIALAGLVIVAAVATLLPPVAVAALTAAVLFVSLAPVLSPRFGRLINEPMAGRQP